VLLRLAGWLGGELARAPVAGDGGGPTVGGMPRVILCALSALTLIVFYFLLSAAA
jgi:hypothetical protein